MKTILIVIFTILITVFLMMNTDAVEFNFIVTSKPVSKLAVIGICTLIGFVLGYWAGRPRTVVSTYDDKFDHDQHTGPSSEQKDGLSDEDREYIS